MTRLFAAAASAALACTMVATPTFAATGSGSHDKNLIDCLGLLFGDPKVHEAECGPFTQPPFWFPTGGSGPACAQVTELSPSQRVGSRISGLSDLYVVATAPTACSCSVLTEEPWLPLNSITELDIEKRTLIAFPAPDPCR
jgi:hypothetical protein